MHLPSHHPSFAGLDTSKPCPREPWHDIHAKVEGPAAVDVAINFIERWVKQAGTRNMFKLVGGIGLHHRKVDVLLPEGLQQYLVRRLGLRLLLRCCTCGHAVCSCKCC
jgi:phosphatidylserine/phosphatidylglycerophosphate/cardiolipin synthase-like enzyme